MSHKPKDSPAALLEFFKQLDPSGMADEECDLHYGCSCVINKGHEAAKMLVTIQTFLGGPPEAKSGDSAGSGGGTNQAEIDSLLLQNMELAKENKSLKEKLAMLQKQVERLYNKNEMSTTLKRLEGKKLTDVEKIDVGGNPATDPTVEMDAPAAEAEPGSKNKELSDALSYEAVARVPKEETKKEGE